MTTTQLVCQILLAVLLPVVIHSQSAFPASWEGNWNGVVEIYSVYGLEQSVPMQLQIQPTGQDSTWTWRIIYGSGEEASTRDYRLRPVDIAGAHWETDEQNAIRLDGFMLGGTFYTVYEVDDLRFTTSTRLADRRLEYELVVSKGTPLRVTGDTPEVPKVSGFEVRSVQRATLIR